MTSDQVLRLQNAAPFKPYWISLADCRSITVSHPDHVSVSGENEIISVDDDSGGVEIVDSAFVISLRYGTPSVARV